MARCPSPSFPSYTSRRGRPPLNEERQLTAAELLRARLVLAEDMVHLVLEDGQGLSAEAQQTLEAFAQALQGLRHTLRDWP